MASTEAHQLQPEVGGTRSMKRCCNLCVTSPLPKLLWLECTSSARNDASGEPDPKEGVIPPDAAVVNDRVAQAVSRSTVALEEPICDYSDFHRRHLRRTVQSTLLVELKFTTEPADATDIDSFYKNIKTKADNTMGAMVSISGY